MPTDQQEINTCNQCGGTIAIVLWDGKPMWMRPGCAVMGCDPKRYSEVPVVQGSREIRRVEVGDGAA